MSPSTGVCIVLALASTLCACTREKRDFDPPSASASAPEVGRTSGLRPGAGEPLQAGHAAAPEPADYDYNAFAVNQGKRLYRWYNCNGCHAGGGGSIGPALMDDKWLYGHRPADIYATIVQGRPNGMPAFGGRIPEDQVWQIVAYVRSMSGLLRKDVAPSRGDSLSGPAPENERDEETPIPQHDKPPAPSPAASDTSFSAAPAASAAMRAP